MHQYSSLPIWGELVNMVWTAIQSVFQGLCQIMTESISQEFRRPAVSEVCLGDLPSTGPSLRHSALLCGEGRSFMSWAAAWACGWVLGMWLELRLELESHETVFRGKSKFRAIERTYYPDMKGESGSEEWRKKTRLGQGRCHKTRTRRVGPGLCRERVPRDCSY